MLPVFIAAILSLSPADKRAQRYGDDSRCRTSGRRCSGGALPATSILYTSTPQTVTAGLCSGAATLATRNIAGNSANVTGTTTVALSSTSGTTRFYSDSGCASLVTSVTIGTGSSNASFYFIDGAGGSPTLTASATGGLTSSANQGETINATGITPFTGDFETGNLSAWSFTNTTSGFTMAASAASAHRGSYGLEVVNSSNSTCGSSKTFVQHNEPSNATGSIYARFWWRVRSGTTPAPNFGRDMIFSQIKPTVGSTMGDLSYASPNANQIVMTGSDISGSTQDAYASLVSSDTAWHLVEESVLNVGVTGGSRKFILDGTTVSSRTGLNFTGLFHNYQRMGQAYCSNPNFTGTMDFDDWRTTTSPPPGKIALTVSGSTSVSAGACVTANINLVDNWSGAASNAPYAITATLANSLGGNWYSGSSCTGSITTASIASGSSSGGTVYFKATAADSNALSATATDFLSSGTTLTVAATAQTQLVFSSSAYSGPGNTCIAATVQSRDAMGNLTLPAGTSVVSLSSSSATTGFYSDSGCTAGITSINLTAGAATFYMLEPYYVSPLITATNGSYTATQTQTQTQGLLLKFAGTATPLNAARGEVGTFARASAATCGTGATYTRVTSGTPCVDATLGVRLDTGTTNKALYSEQIDNTAAWTPQSLSGVILPVVTANVVNGPDGTQTAEQIDFPAIATSLQYAYVSQTFTGSANWSGSLWLRTVSGTGTLYLTALRSTGTYTGTTACALTTAWSRCVMPNMSIGTASWDLEIGWDGRDTNQPSSQSALSVYVSSAQVETHLDPTSYITTTGTAVTRPDESFYVTIPAGDRHGNAFSVSMDYTPVWTVPPTGYISNAIDTDPFLIDTYGSGGGFRLSMNTTGSLVMIGSPNLTSSIVGWSAGTTYHLQMDSTGTTGSTIKRAGTSIASGTFTPYGPSDATKYYLGGWVATNNPAAGYIKNVCIGSASGTCP